MAAARRLAARWCSGGSFTQRLPVQDRTDDSNVLYGTRASETGV